MTLEVTEESTKNFAEDAGKTSKAIHDVYNDFHN